MKSTLQFEIKKQPDDVTCGPTCLHSVYQYYGDHISLSDTIKEVSQLASGGTLAVLLGNHALSRGYKVTIYTYNLTTFDPSWFDGNIDIAEKLRLQVKAKPDSKKLRMATGEYLRFLEMGGTIDFKELTPNFLRSFLRSGLPVLTGLNATYLYESPREVGDFEIRFDDVAGFATGHFVVITGYNEKEVFVADPLEDNPFDKRHHYTISFQKLINSIMLGVMTYDANLLIIHPKK